MNQPTSSSSGPDPSPESPVWTGPERRVRQRRQNVVDRRMIDGGLPTGLERRRGPGRRRSDFIKAAEEGQMTAEQFLFVSAIDAYKRVNHVLFPSWTQVLEVIRRLGYRKTCPSSLNLPNCEDWTEPPDAPAFPPPGALHPSEHRPPNNPDA